MSDKDKEPKRGRGRPQDPVDKGTSSLDDGPVFEFVPRDIEAEKQDIEATKAKAAKASRTPLKGQ